MIPKAELDVFLDLINLNVIFDVGSRDDLDMYELIPNATYHLFEPHIEFIGDMKARLRKLGEPKNIILNEFGLSDENGEGIYYEQIQSFVNRPFDWKMDERIYQLRTLDWYCTEKGITQIDFLKIDAEGYDYKILLGAKETLKKTRYIQVEWGNVERLVNVLKDDFDLFLMMEPELEKVFRKRGDPVRLLMPLTPGLIKILDEAISPTGAGGNILGVRK